MCGLLVSVNVDIPYSGFLKALSHQSYRGPDSINVFSTPSLRLGHVRLKVLDLSSNADQPFSSSCGRYTIVFNGEIYNYKDIVKKYNFQCTTTSDTEVLLKLYELKKEKCLHELNGDFAFIVYDATQRSLFIARDRLGVKPLFFSYHKNGIIFSSEPKSILEITNDHVISERGLRQYKVMRGFFDGCTIYNSVYSFPPGHYSAIDHESTKVIPKQYWDFIPTLDRTVSIHEIRKLIKDAVEIRMTSDVPVGAFLSGGLDSSIIAAIAKVERTYSVGMEVHNESQYAETMAKHIGSLHSSSFVSNSSYRTILKEILQERSEVLMVPNEVLLYTLGKVIKRHCTVMLSGEGADEAFAGYSRIFDWSQGNDFCIKAFSEIYCYTKDIDYEIVEDIIKPIQKKFDSNAQIVSYFMQREHLSNLLRRLDSSAMLNSIEARVPYVDHRLIELLGTVNYSCKRNGNGGPKALLKLAFEEHLPISIANREKLGFPVPLEEIYNTGNKKAGYDAWFLDNLNLLMESKK